MDVCLVVSTANCIDRWLLPCMASLYGGYGSLPVLMSCLLDVQLLVWMDGYLYVQFLVFIILYLYIQYDYLYMYMNDYLFVHESACMHNF